jgi:hypothetical protein
MQHMGVVKDFQINFGSATSTPPAIVSQPQSLTVPQGSNATFTVTASGSAPLSYQWYFAGGLLTNATGTSFTRTNAQTADAGDYFVIVSNVANRATSEVATLTVSLAPNIAGQPQSQTVLAGQNATFTVLASGPSLTYQWLFNGNTISNANASSYTRTNVEPADGGNYSVLVTNSSGSATSAVALLTVLVQGSSVIAQWNFNNTNVSLTSPPPSTGSGTVALVGGTTSAWFGGSATDPGSPNNGWNTMNYPAQGTGNKSAGAQFNVSTLGFQNIVVRWDQRVSNTGSKYARLQYSTNGNNFLDYPTPTVINAATFFEPKTNSLTGIAGVNNNSNFAFRIVAEFESTAANTANANYVGAAGSYGTGGTIRFDMMTVSGTPIPGAPAAPVLGAPTLTNGQFGFTVTGTAGASYAVQGATNLSGIWNPLVTNVSPFTFLDTNVLFPQRYYRALSVP